MHDRQLSESISLLAQAVCGLTEQLIADSATKSILCRIECNIEKLMATQQELVADLKAANTQLKKLVADTAGIQPSVDALKAKIVELEALVAAGTGTPISQELIDAVAETKSLAQVVDDNVPELQEPPVV